MTTINAAAALHLGMRGKNAALLILFAAALAGCSTGSGDLLQGGTSPLTTTALQAPAAAARSKIAIAPIIGAPDQVGKQITARLGAETAKNNIAVANNPGEAVDYTLRGYIVAAREATATKVSYIWDVTNPAGARVHRITGEEVVSGAGAGDPWASVSPEVIGVIASKTSAQLTTWIPQKAPTNLPIAATQPSSGTPIASAATTPQGTRSGLQPPPSAPLATGTTASSVARPGALTALVPSVVGAPGDGSVALATALRNELLRNGVPPTPPGAPAYRVEGRVTMGAAEGGQQPIKIDWVVRDPKGVSLGTVSQENKIAAGSLDKNWGGTANAAATAASQGILKLLPTRTASR